MDGQQKTAAWEYRAMVVGRLTISAIQTMPGRWALRSAMIASSSFCSSGVSDSPAHSTTWIPASSRGIACSRYSRPFCRVMRPTNRT